MPDEDVTLLADAYRAYRGRIHELSLQESEGVVGDDEFVELREAVIAVWNRLMGALMPSRRPGLRCLPYNRQPELPTMVMRKGM